MDTGMKKRVLFDPFHESDCNSLVSTTDGHVELFCVGFKLQEYLNTTSGLDQTLFMRKAESLFEKYRAISPTYHIHPAEGIRLIENLRIGTLNSATEFARRLTPHPFLRDAFLKLYP
jgi:hypothetical protein